MWTEQVARRALCGKTWRSESGLYVYENRLKTRLHYGDGYQSEVNFSPRRVNAGGFDGWTITDAPWRYGIGARDGLGDGWNGAAISGRRIWWRLEQFGWLHWPTRGWEQIGGAPTYDRDNLSANARELVLGPDGGVQSIYASAIAQWQHLWTTPGGGDVSIEWMLEGRRAKEEIVLNQEARGWVANNAMPSNGAWEQDDTYWTMLFKLDGVGDFDWNVSIDDGNDDDGRIELRHLGQLLFYLPIDYLWSSGDDEQRVRLHKRVFTVGGNVWLAVGARLSDVAQLPAGDLRFDPTFETQPAADDGKDNYTQSTTPTKNNSTLANIRISDTFIWRGLLEFDLSAIPANAVVSAVTLDYYVTDTGSPGPTFSRIMPANDWVEDESCWNHPKSGSYWAGDADEDGGADAGCSQSGTDYDATPAATGSGIIGARTATFTEDGVADVQGWIDGSWANNGLVITGGATTRIKIASSDEANADQHPKFTVEYEASGSVTIGGWIIGGGGVG